MFGVVAGVVVLLVINTITTKMVYGSRLRDAAIVPFLESELKSYHLNPYSEDRSILSADYNRLGNPFISEISMGTFSKYYIFGKGTVPRWSKAHKLIRNRFLELKSLEENASETL